MIGQQLVDVDDFTDGHVGPCEDERRQRCHARRSIVGVPIQINGNVSLIGSGAVVDIHLDGFEGECPGRFILIPHIEAAVIFVADHIRRGIVAQVKDVAAIKFQRH